MYKKLHIKMTVFCGLITGLILFLMTAAGLLGFTRLLRANDAAVYDQTVLTVLSALEEAAYIDHAKISELADPASYTLLAYEEGTAYSLPLTQKQQQLMEQACRRALEEYSLDGSALPVVRSPEKRAEFSMTEDGMEYLASFSMVPHGSRTLCAVLLYERSRLQGQLFHLRLFLLCIDCAALLLLFAAAWLYTGKMLVPIEDSRKKQMEFVAAASHELRSPLAVLLSSADALAVAGEPDRPGFHDAIRSEGQRMSRLINDMLILAGADSQSWPMEPTPTVLDELIPELYEKYQPLAKARRLRLAISLPDCGESFWALCDRGRISQVLEILLDNALGCTPAGGTVTLGITSGHSGPTLWVRDTGPGVPDQWKKQIFERFFRGDASRGDREHFGLGLSIAGEIIRLHRGRIWLEDAPGGGAVFYVSLPGTAKGRE